ncbi:MAG TPA: FAD-dependent oxidoreductase [Christensenellaceae bacterium]|nr:FAD-dependent oxidoreductase [Christensenellaceae bacterium]
MKYDVIIVGAGPAGCSAALTARQRNLKTLVVYNAEGAMEKAHRVDNYPGMPNISGKEFIKITREQMLEAGAELRKGLVQKIVPMGGSFSCLVENDIYEASSIILACGTARVRTLQNEEELLGQGVSYCATCDGMFYRGKTVIVVGSGGESVEEANYLAEITKVKYCSEKKHDTSKLNENITLIDDKPRSIEKSDEGMKLICDKLEHVADGIFVIRPAIALTQLLPELEVKDGSVYVDKDMATNVNGVFAAGDMVGQPFQVAKATGEGNIAALSASKYIKQAENE